MMVHVTPRRNVAFSVAALSVALWTGACGDDRIEPPPPDPPRPTTVTVSPASALLSALEATVQLTAEVSDQYGQVMTGTVVTWTSGDAAVASVDGSGLVTAVDNGTVTITATAEDAQGTSEITVSTWDRAALVALYEAADGPNWVDNENWTTDAPLRDWYGVETDGDGRVVRLDLVGRWDSETQTYVPHGLSGPIPPDVGSLANLTWLDLAGNELTGVIPPELGNLGNLTSLNLRANSLTGPIPPELGSLANLTGLYLAGNEFYGPIPPELGNLTNLSGLNLRANSFSGPIPPEVGSLGNLTWLDLGENALSGPIPPELGSLGNLTSLNLNANSLSGPIPPELGNLGNLTWLDLGGNTLSGPIPPEVGDLGNLTGLNLNANGFTGPIPPELGNLSSLTRLSLAYNNLTGPIPPELYGLVKLRRLYFGENALTGAIPPELGSLGELTWLDLSENALSGAIPPELGSLGDLTRLDLDDNNLSGPIPPELGNLANLRSLDISGNHLTGPIPHSFMLLDQLVRFYASSNHLCLPGVSALAEWLRGIQSTDGIRSRIARCNAADVVALEALYDAAGGDGWINSDGWLSDRDLEEWHGVTTDSIGRVTELDLAGNGLAGHLPARMGDLARIAVLRMGDNALSGRLPLTLTRLALSELRYAGTDLCTPSEESFQDWLDGISSHEGTGTECAPLSDRDVLATLYNTAGGPNWARNDNWLTDAPLGEWDGVEVDGNDHVVDLFLRRNNLIGSIPPELGSLANLRELDLNLNGLTDPIPPELGLYDPMPSKVVRR